jgi:hypothetical protein
MQEKRQEDFNDTGVQLEMNVGYQKSVGGFREALKGLRLGLGTTKGEREGM